MEKKSIKHVVHVASCSLLHTFLSLVNIVEAGLLNLFLKSKPPCSNGKKSIKHVVHVASCSLLHTFLSLVNIVEAGHVLKTCS